MREEFVELSKKYKKLKYKNFIGFKKNLELKNGFKNVIKIPSIILFLVFIGIEVLFVKFLPWIFPTLLGILIVYLIALMFSCMVEIKVEKDKILIKKFIFKKVIEKENINRIYLTTSKNKSLGGIRAKIKIDYKTKRGTDFYSIDTMFLKCKDVENLLKIIDIEPLSKEEQKGNFDETRFVDVTLIEAVDYFFLIPIGLCILVNFFLYGF